jgi:putative transposase
MEEKNTKEEIRILKKLARNTKHPRMKIRYDAVRLSLEGRPYVEIARILDLTYQTISIYVKSYKESGVVGLAPKENKGRTKKLTEEQEKQLYDCISLKLPKDVGFKPFVNWTAPLACQWVLKEFGVKFTDRGMRNVFDRLDLSYTRPTYVLKKADPEKQEAFKDDFKHLKKINLWRNRPHFVFGRIHDP